MIQGDERRGALWSKRSAAAVASAMVGALAWTASAGAQPAEGAAQPAARVACGASFAEAGASTNAAYAGGQLRACDRALVEAETPAELRAAADAAKQAHEGVLARWAAVSRELVEASSSPLAPVLGPRRSAPVPEPQPAAAPADGEGEEDAATAETAAQTPSQSASFPGGINPNATDPWSVKWRERHTLETAMDGLRLLIRLSYQIETEYADPAVLVATLSEDQASFAPDALTSRRVCVSAGRPSAPGRPGTVPSWFMYAEFNRDFTAEELESMPVYEREISDRMAEAAAAYLEDGLAAAPALGVSGLASFSSKRNCGRREFPSERDENS